MHIRNALTMAPTVLAVSLALGGCTQPGLKRQPSATRAAAAAYEKLLAMYPEESQGRGGDNHFQRSAPEHQPMAYHLPMIGNRYTIS